MGSDKLVEKKALLLPDWMIIDAFRYALGRRSHQVKVTCDWLITNWEGLPEQIQAVIAREIEEAFAEAGRFGRSYPLGDDCDRTDWARVQLFCPFRFEAE